MRWEKKGIIFSPEGQYEWVITHAMLPVAEQIEGEIYKIYFSGRDRHNRSLIGYAVIDINEPTNIIRISDKPLLGLGDLGCFDDNGVTPTWLVNYEGKKYLYYLGWNKGSTVRAAEVTGLAISTDGGETFVRYSRSPILDRTEREPYMILVASCIIIENGIWRMWYDSADRWINNELPRYNIKYAESKDGINWIRKGIASIDYKDKDETRVSRASVIKEDHTYKMWYCYAFGSGGYRIGYAESGDGIQFQRKDDIVGINISESGWDSEMICYPYVFKHENQKYMLYCGNGYGRTGFGYAMFAED